MQRKERKRERPRKCLRGARQEEVPAAVTTAVALVAMGTSRAGEKKEEEETQFGHRGQTDSVLPLFFLKEGKIRGNYVKQHSLFVTFWYFTSSQTICFSTWNPICGKLVM